MAVICDYELPDFITASEGVCKIAVITMIKLYKKLTPCMQFGVSLLFSSSRLLSLPG